MVTLLLRRSKALAMSEIGKLPSGCVAVQGESDVVARARLDTSLERLLNLAVRMGRAVPDARFDAIVDDEPRRIGRSPAVSRTPDVPVEVGAPADASTLPATADDSVAGDSVAGDSVAGDSVAGDSAADEPVPDGPWALLAEGRHDDAIALLDGVGLDSDGRDRVRAMLLSTDPGQIALGCRVARATGWRSSVQMIRRIVQHGDTEVRRRAVQAIGDLAGPGMVPLVQPLLQDANPEVREAAQVALATMDG